MVLRSRAHILNLQVEDGTANVIDFNLNPGSRLTHVAVNIGAAGPPIRVAVTLIQPRVNAAVVNTLCSGWIRGHGMTPSQSGDVTWDGDIEIGTDMAIRFRARNNTGATHGPAAAIMVIE